jgi:cytochrome c oxidase cbb3-type subunit 3
MADFVSNFWHWFVVIISLVSIIVLIPLIFMNRQKKLPGEVGTMGHVWDDDLEEYDNPLPGWWFNMFLITIIFGLVYLVLYPGLGKFEGLLGWSSKGQYEAEMGRAAEHYDPLFKQYAAVEIDELSANAEAMKTGERLFANYCAVCHGSDARGARGFPNLRDGDWLWGGDTEQIRTSILDGRIGVMPPWGDALGEEGVTNVANYVASLGARKVDPDEAAKGKEKYDQLCVACHMPDGSGNPALGAPNLTDRMWLYGGSMETIKESIRDGRNGKMPAHRDFLGEDRVHLLSAYVYSLSQEYERE